MRFNRYRLKVVQVDSRMSRLANNLRLRLCASREVIAEIQRIWEAFALPTPARANPLPGPIPPPRARRREGVGVSGIRSAACNAGLFHPPGGGHPPKIADRTGQIRPTAPGSPSFSRLAPPPGTPPAAIRGSPRGLGSRDLSLTTRCRRP